jgi:hypothetical protein
MKVRREGAFMLVEVRMAAFVPAGHDVLVLSLLYGRPGSLGPNSAEVIVDTTTKTLYADEDYWTALERAGWPAEPPANNPVGALGEGWEEARHFQGRASGSVVSTRRGSDNYSVLSLLYVTPQPSA